MSNNLRQRRQVDKDSCNGLFDTRAGPMAGVSCLLNKRAFARHLGNDFLGSTQDELPLGRYMVEYGELMKSGRVSNILLHARAY